MRFCDLLDAARSHPLEVTIPAEWAQGRASFGGLVAALQYEALRAQVPADRPLRSLAITFVGPVAPGVPASYQVEVLREGKAVSQLLGRVVQNGEVATLVQASFGASRESQVVVASEPPPTFKHWDECQELPYIQGVTPEFMRHLAMRWSVGGLPFTGSTLTWTIEFIQPLQDLTTLDWCQYHVTIEHARDGYGHAAAALWSPAGELIAISRQTVVVFA